MLGTLLRLLRSHLVAVWGCILSLYLLFSSHLAAQVVRSLSAGAAVHAAPAVRLRAEDGWRPPVADTLEARPGVLPSRGAALAPGSVLAEACWQARKSWLNAARAPNLEPAIIPLPAEMACSGSLESKGFVLDANTPLYPTGAAAVVAKSFEEYFECLFGFVLHQVSAPAPGRVELVEHSASKLPPEGYTLEVSDDGALILGMSAASPRASLLNALQTLRQLLPPAVFGASPRESLPLTVPRCKIRDWPRYRWRGLMLDVARHFFRLDQVKQLLLLMSMHKFNILHLHLSDDQGWRIEVQNRPELALVGGMRGRSINRPEGDGNGEKIYNGTPYAAPHFFSQNEVRELVAFATALGIEIVPEIDVPAHTAALIVAARSEGRDFGVVRLHEGCDEQQGTEELAAPPNCMGGTHGIIVPTEAAMSYVLGAIEEVVGLFPGRYFHIGGDEADEFRDEVYDMEAVESLKQSLLIKNSVHLQGYVVDQVHKLVTRHGKTAIAWDEAHFGLEDYKPPKDVLAMWWRDWSPEAYWEDVQELGPRLILAPAGRMYLDLYQVEPHSASRHRVQEGTVPLWKTYGAADLEAPGVLGVHACLWSEHFDSAKVLEYQLFPRGAAVAEVGWTPKHRAADFDGFLRRWQVHAERLAALGVDFYNGTYTGKEVL